MIVSICNIEVGSIRRDSMGLVKSCARSRGIRGAGSPRRSCESRHHSAGNHDLADLVVIIISHIKIVPVGGHLHWVIKPRRSACGIGGSRSPGRSGQGGHDSSGDHDLADCMVILIRNIEVGTVASYASGFIKPCRSAHGIRASGRPCCSSKCGYLPRKV